MSIGEQEDDEPGAGQLRQSIFSKRWFRALGASALVAGFAAGGFGIAQATTKPKSPSATDAASSASPWGQRAGHFGNRHAFPVAVGTVESVGSKSFTLKGFDGKTVTVDVSSSTSYKEQAAKSATFANVKKGETVAVEGTTASGKITAKKVFLGLRGFGHPGGGRFGPGMSPAFGHPMLPAAVGTVESVGSKSFTLKGFDGKTVTVDVSSSTTYKDRAVKSATFSTIKKGDVVAALGKSASGKITAKSVFIGLGGHGGFMGRSGHNHGNGGGFAPGWAA